MFATSYELVFHDLAPRTVSFDMSPSELHGIDIKSDLKVRVTFVLTKEQERQVQGNPPHKLMLTRAQWKEIKRQAKEANQ